MTERYDYHVGIKTYEDAVDAVNDAIADGYVSFSEMPEIKCYFVTGYNGKNMRRYKITLEA